MRERVEVVYDHITSPRSMLQNIEALLHNEIAYKPFVLYRAIKFTQINT